MSFFIVDVEATGPIPGENDYSMIELGAVLLDEHLETTFYRKVRPISNRFEPEALAAIGTTWEEIKARPDAVGAKMTMVNFATWIGAVNGAGEPQLISDNNQFDGMYVAWYFHHFLGRNPFGWSSHHADDLYYGLRKTNVGNMDVLRRTPHTHHPVDDAKGVAEAMRTMIDAMGLTMVPRRLR